ncbi:RHS repeat protein [Salmonella enterica]|nr:RHS repeat protein [Salmonella enterica]EFW6054618.1 RHS repeat protein [Salmonella enterica]EGH5014799.1 RHS repeat protein [Salmonella enterica]EHM5449708.1 RHS repeat protein [Salmonella enterica]EHO8997940.1 RHS repeat protein [Salmonella enterica]
MSTSLFSKTPSVTVLDNRGLTVRDIAYHRHPDTPDITSERITRHQYDARGFLTQSADPRLHDAGLANFTYLTDLAGNVLCSQGVDNGITVALNDAAGRAFIAVSNISTTGDGPVDRSQAVTRTWQYEDSELPGRPLSITEQVNGEAARITERFVYAGHTDAEKALNLAGACVSHYDTAGLTQTDSVALTGVPLSVSRRLLKDADNPDAVADWKGEDATAWNDLLDGEAYNTQTTADATGAVLTSTDAKGNLQRVAYDVAGLLSGNWLTVKGGTEQVIVASLTYSAAGQKLREEHGNGVVTTYTYEAETQRLTGIKTERPAGHASGARVLQDLRYEYDPVGNVLCVRNDAEETRFWRNQKVVPENTYVYDSLYQLVSATGREMADAGQQGSSLPSATIPFPTDSSAFTNYTRNYIYDEAGNLMQVRHSAPATNNSYTTNITVSDRSNRAVLSSLAEIPAEVDALFTAGGQQKQLQPGQSLFWTPRSELLKVTPVVRDGSTDDRESYRYDGGSQRILKTSVQKTGSSTQTQRVLYLPGLELRTTASGNTATESLQVITVGKAGRAQVRVLRWVSGKPDVISNDQVRYSYDNLTGSSRLELDSDGNIISMEEYYPYGGTAVWAARSAMEADYKTVRYSGKERDATGLYYYGYRYYQPWVGRWLSADPADMVDGLNLFRMVRNNPVTLHDPDGLAPGGLLDKFRNSFRKTNQPTISALKNTGPFYTKSETDIDIDFLFSRQDSLESFSPQSYKALSAKSKRGVLEVAMGGNITSENRGAKWYAGTHWEKKPLKNTIDLVVLHNGMQGAAGINIDMAEIKAGRSVLVTAGTLSGCTMITGVKDNHFYALHAGTGTPTGEWLTSQHGVRDNIRLFNELIPESGLTLGNTTGAGETNDNLLPVLDYFDSGTIAYSGKPGSEMSRETENILNYHTKGLATTVGVSFSLLTKKINGGLSASTLLELGELSPHNPPKTKGEFGQIVLKYKALNNKIIKLI